MALLVLVAGPSQSGKSTLISRFVDEFSNAVRLPTATSRPMRTGEKHGVDKYFISEREFTDHSKRFLEHVVEHGNHYGILKDVFDDYMRRYDVVFMDLDIRGVRSVLAKTTHRVLPIFVTPDTFEEIVERIQRRGDANVLARIESARHEWLYKTDPMFKAVIHTSCSVDESYEKFRKIVLAHLSN